MISIFMDWKAWYRKCPYYPRWFIDLVQCLSKYQRHFYRNRKENLTIVMEPQNISKLAKLILKYNRVGGITFSYLKIYHNTAVIKIKQYQYKERYIDQWNSINISEINHAYRISWSSTKSLRVHKGEMVVFLINGVEILDIQ